MKFQYPRLMFGIKAMAFLAILICILYLMEMAEVSVAWLAGFSVIFILTILIAYITPMLTQHEIDSNGITLRQGLIFNTSFPFHLIESAEPYTSNVGFLGVISRRGRIVLANGSKGLVIIKLNHMKRFGMLLLRRDIYFAGRA